MSVDIYGTHVLAGVIRESKPTLPGFWLNFVTRVYNSEVAEIHFDRVTGLARKVAPYVMPTVAGKVQRHGGFQTEKFTPAYVKISDTIDPSRTLSRRPGEPYGGMMSPSQRRDALLAEYLQEQRDAIERRWNLMAAEVMQNGTLVIAGDDYPTTTIDFGRAANQTVTLLAGSRWTDSGVSALDNLEDWSVRVQDGCNYPVTDVVMGTSAWRAFRKNGELKELLDLSRGGESLGGLDILPGSGNPLQYKGTDGTKQYWVYRESYDISETQSVEIMDPRDVLLIAADGLGLVQAFGAILDVDVLQPLPIFTKSWVENEPSARKLLSQSSPLMIPSRPNATMRARVVA